ncbi:MAG TPA: type II toxin-antitoxin system prevent-host-death family antitoxin [Rhizomicrobium sp.]
MANQILNASNRWPISKVKANFSAFLRAAEKSPQIVTVRGAAKAEVRLLSQVKKSKSVKLLQKED